MKKSALVTRSLTHYWRTHLAVLLGVIAGTAVIAGALVVGDSVRESLRQMSLDRLGGVDHAVTSRFVTQSLIKEFADKVERDERFETAAPALIMDGYLVRSQPDGTVTGRVGGVRVFGVDESFADLSEFAAEDLPTGEEIVLSHRVADQIGASENDELTLWLELPATIPKESLLGGIEEEDSTEFPVTVKSVLPETSGVGRFDLNPSQQLPLTVFVALDELQTTVGLEEVRPRRSRENPNPTIKPARVNAVFVSATDEQDRTGDRAPEAAERLTEMLAEPLTLSDLNLRTAIPQKTVDGQPVDRGYIALESEQMILEDAYADAARRLTSERGLQTSSTLVYLINELINPNVEPGDPNDEAPAGYSMYSIVAGIDPTEVSGAPFGPLFSEGTKAPTLGDRDIVLDDWVAESLKVSVGDKVVVRYHLVGSHGELPEEEVELTIRAIVPLETSVTAADRGLTPDVPGITDARTFGDWKRPFPMDIGRVTERDDLFWETYGPLPKSFVSLSTAQELWKSRYGKLTAFRFQPIGDQDIRSSRDDFERSFLNELTPAETGLAMQPVKYNGVSAASGTTDFTGLFIGFSFFVIAAATILIGLLFRLGVERRASGIGLLQAVGFSSRQVRNLILVEGLLVAVVGGLIGCVVAVKYADLMVFALKDPEWWGGAIGTQFLNVSVQPVSLIAGFGISVFVALIALLLALRGLKDISTRQLLAGSTVVEASDDDRERFVTRRRKWARIGFAVSLIVVIAGVARLIPASEAGFGITWQIAAFFVVGITLLTSAMFQLSAWLSGDRRAAVRGSGLTGTGRLGFRNAARHRARSVMSTGLIASATFVIVAVASGRRDPSIETPDVSSGNGGFALVAETSTPTTRGDLATHEGRTELGFNVEDGSPEAKLLEDMAAYSFRVRPGENASCLNLYQTQLPTILGIPDDLVARGGFRFIDQRKADYWKVLTEDHEDGNIPVLGDMNTLMYSLHKGPGTTIDLPDSDTKLVVSGMFDSSVFQGVLVMSDANFQKLFPEEPGFRYFLIGANEQRAASEAGHFTEAELTALSTLLESSLTPYGFDAERVADRIAAFLVVQNTYLSTFQSLGGLGLLLGTLGLATVMLRNVVERRSELALLRAVGFRRSGLSIMVLAENAMLLIWGLLAGTVCALLAMLPHLQSAGADTPWIDGAKLLGLVFIFGSAAALFAVREASRTPIVSTLRGD